MQCDILASYNIRYNEYCLKSNETIKISVTGMIRIIIYDIVIMSITENISNRRSKEIHGTFKIISFFICVTDIKINQMGKNRNEKLFLWT
jgi:hypothetical protein